MKKLVNKTTFLIAVFLFAVVFLISLTFLRLPIQGMFYWLLVIYWIMLVSRLRLSSAASLKLALCFFTLSIFINLSPFQNTAETIMRICILFLIVGIPHALIESLKDKT